jgi:tetratricopeptide (TPR) repeat protein
VRVWLITIFIAVLVTPSMAFAQEGEEEGQEGETPSGDDAEVSPEDPQAAQRARERFQAGMEHFQAHRYRDAIHEFELAASLVPSADIWFNIARAWEELGEYEPAIEYYRRYLRDRVDPPDRQRVEQHIAELEERMEAERQQGQHAPTTGTLRIRANQDGATVIVDGREVGESPLSVPITTQPGEHEVMVEKEGYLPFRSQVNVQAGGDTTAYADLVEATEYRAVRGSRIFTWIAGGLAVVSGGVAIGLAVSANSQLDEWEQSGSTPDSRDPALLQQSRDTALISDIMLGTAIGLAVVAIVLYFIEGRAVATERVAGGDVALLEF